MSAFRAVFKEASMFKRIIESLKPIVEKCNFDCSDQGIGVQCMDNSHVSLVSLHINENSFSEYVCPKPLTMGLNLATLGKIFKTIDSDTTLTLEMMKKDDAILNITAEKRTTLLKYSLNLIEIDEDTVEIDEIESSCVVTMPSNDLLKIAKDFSSLDGDAITISCKKTEVEFSAKTNKCETSMTISTNNDVEEEIITIEHTEDVQVQFALKNISEFAKAATLAEKVKLHLNDSNPLIMEFNSEGCDLKFFLAPKVDDEEVEE